jgi:hypothetical protein
MPGGILVYERAIETICSRIPGPVLLKFLSLTAHYGQCRVPLASTRGFIFVLQILSLNLCTRISMTLMPFPVFFVIAVPILVPVAQFMQVSL